MSSQKFHSRNIDRMPIRVEFNDAQYPKRVKNIMSNKTPKHLDMVGNIDLLSMVGIGFCGSRKASLKGLNTAQDCAEQAARNNVCVISGNATGVDFEAHYNCLNAGGRTILIIPEGINNFRIRKALKSVWDWDRVLVVSQFEPDEPWKVFRAMMRNSLVIALSRAVIVIEAGEKGGTLSAGKETLECGLPLYVTEYEDMSVNACGNQILLNQGAHKLSKKRSTGRANLEKLFESIKKDSFLKSIPVQEKLLLLED